MDYSDVNFWRANKNYLVFFLLTSAGIVLAFINYLYNRSLWFDEVLLSWNIITRGYTGLAHYLEYSQVAPIGYLWVTKTFVLLFGPVEPSLRLFPFMSYLISIVLVYRLTLKLFGEKIIAWIAASLFALNVSLLYYSSEAKQYMPEVMVALGLIYATIKMNPASFRSMIIFTVIVLVSVWFSMSSVVVLVVCSGFIFVRFIIRDRQFKLFWIFAVIGCHHIFYYFTFLHKHPTSEIMVSFHQNYFFPLDPFSFDFWSFIWVAVQQIFLKLLGFGRLWFPAVLFLFVVIPALSYKKKYSQLYFLLAPLAIHLLLSACKLYPFYGRFILYMIPFFLILIAAGLVYISEFTGRFLKKIPPWVLSIPVILMIYPAVRAVPYEKEEFRKSIAYLNEHRGDHDILYLYYAANYPFDFYLANGYITTHPPLIRGEISRENPERYMESFSGVTGRLWLIFSHVYPFNSDPNENEEAYILEYLAAVGFEILHFQQFAGSSIYLMNVDPHKHQESR